MSDFSDAYFSKLRSAIEPQPKLTDRDVSNRALRLGDQYQPRTEIVDSGGTFTAADEWIQCLSLAPGQAGGFVRLLAEGGGFYTGDEPFYVSGPRIFTVDTGGQVLVQRAVRRELLSRMSSRDWPANGAAFSEVYDDDAINLVIPGGQWAVLTESSPGNLTWELRATFTLPATGYPFGYRATNKNFAGRWYDIEFDLTGTTLGHLSMSKQLVSGNTSLAPAISLERNGVIRGTARIGDAAASAVVAGPQFGTSPADSQAVAQGSSRWSLALYAAAGATFTGQLRIIRQGF